MLAASKRLVRGVFPLLLVVAVGACADDDGGSGPPSTTTTFHCSAPAGDTFDVELQAGPDAATVTLPKRFAPRVRELVQTRAASGARYEGAGAVIWNKGDEAIVVIDGQTYRSCTRVARPSPWDDARRRGVVFRGIGQEPGWMLEVFPDHIQYVGDYGQQTLRFSRTSDSVDTSAGRFIYRGQTESHRMSAVIEKTPCTDVMSGESFSHTVTLRLDGKAFDGCGRVLE